MDLVSPAILSPKRREMKINVEIQDKIRKLQNFSKFKLPNIISSRDHLTIVVQDDPREKRRGFKNRLKRSRGSGSLIPLVSSREKCPEDQIHLLFPNSSSFAQRPPFQYKTQGQNPENERMKNPYSSVMETNRLVVEKSASGELRNSYDDLPVSSSFQK